MSVMDTVAGGVGTGIQPKDNPNPVAPGPSAAAQTFDNSIPAAAPMPQGGMTPPASPAPAPSAPAAPRAPAADSNPQSDDDAAVDELFGALQGAKKPKSVQKAIDKAHESSDAEVDSLFSHFTGEPGSSAKDKASFNLQPGELSNPLIDGQKPTENFFQAKMRQLPAALQMAGAQVRSHLGRTPIEQRQAFESMYGVSNVKAVGGNLFIRPDADSKFRKVDQTLIHPIIDWAIYNSLNAIPLAANVAVTAGTEARMSGGNPIAAAAAVPVSLAAGGAADAATRQGLISGLNLISSEPQDDEHVKLKNEIAKSAGLQVVLGSALRYLPIKGVVSKLGGLVEDGLEKMGLQAGEDGAAEVLSEAGDKIGRLAQVRTAVREFRDMVFPTTSEGAADAASGAVDKAHDLLQKNVGFVKDEAVALAKTKGLKASMDNTIGRTEKILQENGYHFDEQGFAQGFAHESELMQPGRKTALETIAKYHDRLVQERSFPGAGATEGTPTETLFNDLDLLKSRARFDSAVPESGETSSMFRQIYNAAASDRNQHISHLYEGSGLPNEAVWKNAIDKFHTTIDAVTDLQARLATPAQREVFAQSIMKAAPAARIETLDNLRQVVGAQSPEYAALKGEIFDHVVDRFTNQGVVDAPGVVKFLNQKSNEAFVSRILEPQERQVLNRMMIQASKISTSGVFVDSQKPAVDSGILEMVRLFKDPQALVKRVFTMFGSDKKAIDYLTDEGFLNAARQAEGPEIRNRIFEAMRLTEGLTAKMQIVNVPTTAEAGKKAIVQKYAPLLGAGAVDSRFFTPYAPEKAPNPSSTGLPDASGGGQQAPGPDSASVPGQGVNLDKFKRRSSMKSGDQNPFTMAIRG